MELHNDQVPGDTVWAVAVRFGHESDWDLEWFLTPEASSEDYRHVVEYHKTHHGGEAKRWKVTLPCQRMEREDVDIHVRGKLLYSDPDGTTQLLDVSVQARKD